jgi:hypothetical protein
MDDEMTPNWSDPDSAFDDDRLLAYVLGLDDDPELAAAAARDDELGRRLEAVRADVEKIGAETRALVPAPEEGYADLSDPRWAKLREHVSAEAPRPRPPRSRASLWRRGVAPVAAVALALAVGITLVSHSGGGGSSGVSSAESQSAGKAATSPSRFGEKQTDEAAQAAAFAVVVVARAQAVQGSYQPFTVVRTLKGTVPASVRLRVVGGTAKPGELTVLYLQPVASSSGEALSGAGSSSSSASTAPSPSPEPAPASPGAGKGLTPTSTGTGPVVYSYDGQTALVRSLPAGTDPSAVELP